MSSLGSWPGSPLSVSCRDGCSAPGDLGQVHWPCAGRTPGGPAEPTPASSGPRERFCGPFPYKDNSAAGPSGAAGGGRGVTVAVRLQLEPRQELAHEAEAAPHPFLCQRCGCAGLSRGSLWQELGRGPRGQRGRPTEGKVHPLRSRDGTGLFWPKQEAGWDGRGHQGPRAGGVFPPSLPEYL